MATLEEQLMVDEGFRNKPYRDTVGKLTIGVGRNLDDVGISKDEAMFLLRNDIAKAKADLLKNLPWVAGLTQARQEALINMTFNMGIGTLLKFTTTLGLLKAGKYKEASVEMKKSRWASQVGDRAERLSKQIELG